MSLALVQSVADAKEILTIESVSVIGLMLFFMVYLIWQNHLLKKDLSVKDEKIQVMINEHTQTIKEGNKDVLALVNKYHTFVEQLRAMIGHGKR